MHYHKIWIKKLIQLLSGSFLWWGMQTYALPLKEQDPILITSANGLHAATPLLNERLSDSHDYVLHEEDLKHFLKQNAISLNPMVIDKVIASLKCANHYHIEHTPILVVIDYSLPSSEKRLWIFDLKHKTLRFHTYVAHGVGSGELLTTVLSNQNNSRASSLGVFITNKAYYGREGLSLKLQGLERTFNDNAENRYIVMHGGWYMEETFIKKYGRSGRSWGCPALPLKQHRAIIQLIQNHAWVVAFYPSDRWLAQSKYLNCQIKSQTTQASLQTFAPSLKTRQDLRAPIFFTHAKNTHSEPLVLAISALNYEKNFHHQVPLNRMLRRPIHQEEYIALSEDELQQYLNPTSADMLQQLVLVKPVLVNHRGYWATELHLVPTGKITQISKSAEKGKENLASHYQMIRDQQMPIDLTLSHDFIRWIGL